MPNCYSSESSEIPNLPFKLTNFVWRGQNYQLQWTGFVVFSLKVIRVGLCAFFFKTLISLDDLRYFTILMTSFFCHLIEWESQFKSKFFYFSLPKRKKKKQKTSPQICNWSFSRFEKYLSIFLWKILKMDYSVSSGNVLYSF